VSQPLRNSTNSADDEMHEGRRRDLAVAALHTWSEHGYSQVSVRNVARRTRFSHGMVHYYFHSKDALVAECVRMIAEAHIFAAEGTEADGVTEYSRKLADALSDSFRSKRRLHRIRYDLRNQSQFERSLRAYAAEVEDGRERWQKEVQRRYEAMGWTFDPPFELLAEQIDALLERAVRDELLGAGLTETTEQLRRDLLQILPRGD
jgi:AcrR family transcriptional regulator